MKDKKLHFVWNALIFMVFLFFVAGCTRYYNPTETTFPINESMVPAFSGKGTITIENMQPHGKEFVLVSQSGATWKGDLGKWTDTAVNYLVLELTKRNLVVTGTAQKNMKISITDANAIFATWVIRCKLNLRVETGDGYVREFEGNNTSPGTLFRAADGAVMKAVVAALNDPEIVAYLEK
jgi:hypothetical protein